MRFQRFVIGLMALMVMTINLGAEVITPGRKVDQKKEQNEKESNYLKGELNKEDQEYARKMKEELKKARHKLGILNEDEKEEKKKADILGRDKIHVFLGMEAPKMDRIYEYIHQYKQNTEAHVVIHFIHELKTFTELMTGETMEDYTSRFPLTTKFLQKVSEFDDSFPFLPNTAIAHEFALTHVPSFGFQEGGKQRKYLWKGMPKIDPAIQLARESAKLNPDNDEVVMMGDVGQSIPIDLSAIDKEVTLVRKMFDVNNLYRMYEHMKTMDDKVFEKHALNVDEFYKSITSLDPGIPTVRDQHEVKVMDDLPLGTVITKGKRMFFFDAGSASDVSTARQIGTNGYGFCIKWESAAQVAQFRIAVGREFQFMVASDDSLIEEYSIKSIPMMLTVNEGGLSYTREYGF